mmetsp:Transcript_120735/g.337964  ORF Transcript_120735/g.337964 Transcript_120735/m.337964 type:complete len:251 (+) Transcript_120735:321-1073(+)
MMCLHTLSRFHARSPALQLWPIKQANAAARCSSSAWSAACSRSTGSCALAHPWCAPMSLLLARSSRIELSVMCLPACPCSCHLKCGRKRCTSLSAAFLCSRNLCTFAWRRAFSCVCISMCLPELSSPSSTIASNSLSRPRSPRCRQFTMRCGHSVKWANITPAVSSVLHARQTTVRRGQYCAVCASNGGGLHVAWWCCLSPRRTGSWHFWHTSCKFRMVLLSLCAGTASLPDRRQLGHRGSRKRHVSQHA